jgi:hypothetical protein
MKTLVIDCQKWARKTVGVEKGESLLLNSQGNMCCLGFACKQLCELDDSCIDGKGEPNEISRKLPFLVEAVDDFDEENGEYIRYEDTDLSGRAICINDNADTTDTEKEQLLFTLFAKHGIQLTFDN